MARKKNFLSTAGERVHLGIVTALAVLALQGFLGFFPEGISNTWKIIIGVVGGTIVVMGWDKFTKAIKKIKRWFT